MSISSELSSTFNRDLSRGRLEFIDALRGFACVWVLFCHVQGFWLDGRPSNASGLRHILEAAVTGICRVGIAGVDLFIVLSGFCLYWPVVRGWRRGKVFEPKLFFVRRVRRIVPAYYAAIGICAAIALYPPFQRLTTPHPPRWIDVAAYAGFVMNFFPLGSMPRINGTYWSIALEAELYVLFPLTIWIARRFGLKSLIAVAVMISVVMETLEMTSAGSSLGLTVAAYVYHAPARYLEFVLGMTAAAALMSPRRNQGIVGLAAAGLAIPTAMAMSKFAISSWSEVRYAAWGVGFCGLILFLAEVPDRWFSSPLRAGLLTRIGVVSYSLYLLHAPLMLLAAPAVVGLTNQFHLGPLSICPLFLVVGVPTLAAVAYGFFRLFERPFMNPARRPGPILSADPDRPAQVPSLAPAVVA